VAETTSANKSWRSLAWLAAFALLTDIAWAQNPPTQPVNTPPVAPDAKPPSVPPPGGYRLPPICLQHPSIPLCPQVKPAAPKPG
jgi:hypothetical protein